MSKKSKVLICTPCYGGLTYYTYTGSLLNTTWACVEKRIPISVQFIANESLISRARNRLADFFLRSPADKLLFIDADLGWEPADFLRLYESDKLLIGGTYPGKTFPIQLMCNALIEHEETFPHTERTAAQLAQLGSTYGNSRGEVEVRHVPTGFMMIDRRVFEALKPHTPQFVTHAIGSTESLTMYDFFPCGVTADGQYESEDWAFCNRVRTHLNCGVWLNTKVICSHTGTYTFRAGHV